MRLRWRQLNAFVDGVQVQPAVRAVGQRRVEGVVGAWMQAVPATGAQFGTLGLGELGDGMEEFSGVLGGAVVASSGAATRPVSRVNHTT